MGNKRNHDEIFKEEREKCLETSFHNFSHVSILKFVSGKCLFFYITL